MKGKDTMKTVIWMLAALVGLSGLLSAAENGKSPAILLQEALYQEQTEGNLDKAIELYGQVLEQAADVERLAARATYQLGLCHLKKGDKAAAAEYFRKAVSDYPKQTSVVKKSQAELDKIAPEDSVFGNQVIFKDSFEKGDTLPNGWKKGQNVGGVHYIWDRKHGSDGTSSLCMKKTVQKYFPMAQWTRSIEYTGDARELSVSGNVLAKKAYKAVIDALFLDDNGEWIKHEWVSYIGAREKGDPPANHNWKEYSGTVDIPGNTKTIVIGLQMYGPGLVCFDEVEVAYAGDEGTPGKATPNPLKAEDLVAEGWKLWGQRKLAEAEEKFKEAIRSDPDNDGAYQGLGWAQLNQGKKQNAEISFKKCVKLNPENSAALNGLGWIEHGKGNIDIAIKWWDKAVRASKGTATASLSGLTQVYMERQDYAKAVKYYQMWLKAEPNNQNAKDGLDKAKAAMK